MIRFGILSTAKIAREHVAPAIVKAGNARLSGIASREKKKAQRMAACFGADLAYGSYEELLDSDAIDAIYIPLPTSHHIPWTLKAIAAGKHVLCEKPISLNAADIKQLIKARDKAGVIVSEAFMVTYHPQWLKVRDLLKKGAIGRLRMIDTSFTYFNKDANNMRNRPELGGGALPDIGVYPSVAARFATGQEPLALSASVEFDPEFGTDSYAHTQIEFQGFDMRMYVSTQMANRQTMVFHGEKGFIEVSAPFNSNLYEGDEVRLHSRAHDETRVYRYTGVDQYKLQIEAFCKAIGSSRHSAFSLENSLLNQKVIDSIYKAGKSGKRVKI